MANVRIKDLPLGIPAKQSWIPFEVYGSGVYTTTKASLSTVIARGSNYLWQTAGATVSALSANWQNNYITYASDKNRFQTCYSTNTAFSGLWQAGYDAVYAGAATWNTAAVRAATLYTSINPISSTWTTASNTVSSLSSRWESTYTTLNSISANLPRKYAATFGNGVNNPNTITHNLNTRDLIVSVALANSPYTLSAASLITFDTVNALSVSMVATPASNQYRITIMSAA